MTKPITERTGKSLEPHCRMENSLKKKKEKKFKVVMIVYLNYAHISRKHGFGRNVFTFLLISKLKFFWVTNVITILRCHHRWFQRCWTSSPRRPYFFWRWVFVLFSCQFCLSRAKCFFLLCAFCRLFCITYWTLSFSKVTSVGFFWTVIYLNSKL